MNTTYDVAARIRNTALLAARNGDRVWPLVARPHAAAVLPTADAQCGVVWQGRLGANGRQLLEAPAGVIDPGHTAAQTAAKELREEVGFATEELHPVAEGLVDPAVSDERIALFLATGRRATAQRDVDAYILPVWLDAPGRSRALADVCDLKTWALLLAHRLRHPDGAAVPGRPLRAPAGRDMRIVEDVPLRRVGDVALHRVRSTTAVTAQPWENGVAHAPDVVHLVVLRAVGTGYRIVVLPGRPAGGRGDLVTGLPCGPGGDDAGLEAAVDRIARRALGRAVRPVAFTQSLYVSPGYLTRRARFALVTDDSSAPLPRDAELVDPAATPADWRAGRLDLPAQAAALWVAAHMR